MLNLKMERWLRWGMDVLPALGKQKQDNQELKGIRSYAGDTCHSILHETPSQNS